MGLEDAGLVAGMLGKNDRGGAVGGVDQFEVC